MSYEMWKDDLEEKKMIKEKKEYLTPESSQV